MKLPILYSIDSKGKTRQWKIEVSEPDEFESVNIIRTHGICDMKQIEEVRVVTNGKNIGKKNETTSYEQACSEAQSMWNKQLDKGYSETISESSVVSRSSISPMLAHTWNGVSKIEFPCRVQPKLDGVRMLVGRLGGSIILLSRMGKDVISVPHIKDAVSFLKEGQWLDGECFSPKIPFEELAGLFRRKTSDKSLVLEFHVFDYFDINTMSSTFDERYNILSSLPISDPIFIVPTRTANSITNLHEFHTSYVEEDYEGLIIRKPDGLYELRKRSRGLLKFKTMMTEEFQIVDAVEAEGRDEGSVVWVCKVSTGETFRVRPKGSLEHRRNLFQNRHQYIGQNLTVQFQSYTDVGIPRFPVGIAIRDYE